MSVQIKKILFNRPNQGQNSQYNFDEDDSTFIYNDSTSLPENNDKFQRKDLFTQCIGDEINEAIIEKNIKFSGISSIKIDNLYISNAGVDGTVKQNVVRGFIFSEEAYGGDPTKDGYSTVKGKMKDEWRFYSQGFGNRSEHRDIGSIDEVEGKDIVSNFGKNTPSSEVGKDSIRGSTFELEPENENKPFQLNSNENLEDLTVTRLINESEYNPIYIVIYTDGNKKVAWPIKTDKRKKKYSIFKISNEDLFVKTQVGNEVQYLGTTFVANFTSPTSTKTGEGGGGAKASAWKVTSLNVTINTSAGRINSFSEASTTYKDIISLVKPAFKVNRNIFNSFQWLEFLNPRFQLDNNQDASDTPDSLLRHPDFFPMTTFGFNQAGQLGTGFVDLQSYYDDFNSIIKSSTPLNVTFSVQPKKVEDIYPTPDLDIFEGGDRRFYYFIIDWNDKENKFKTIQDWLDSRPDNNFDYLELQNQNLYKVKEIATTLLYDTDVFDNLPFPVYLEEFNITNSWDGTFELSYSAQLHQISTFYEVAVPDGIISPITSEDVQAWRNIGRLDVVQYIEDNNLTDNRTIPRNRSIALWENWNWVDGELNLAIQLQTQFSTFEEYVYDLESNINYPFPTFMLVSPAPTGFNFTPSDQFVNPTLLTNNPIDLSGQVNNVYTTPGIKNIKFIVFSTFDGVGTDESPSFEVGRWKLCTSRIYLDISPNQYPDFADVGGSDYTTLPWPNTNPIIGGVDNNSKYKISIQDTLSSGKILETDIIDEKFLINDLENDEMGKNIEQMDLEQVRYFNQSYNMNNLLQINPMQDIGGGEFLGIVGIYSDGMFHYTLSGQFTDYNSMPNGYENMNYVLLELGISTYAAAAVFGGNGNPTEGDYQFLPQVGTAIDNEGREWKTYDVITVIESVFRPFNDSYYDGETNKYPEESSVGQIFINDNLDLNLKQSCKLELNTGDLIGKSIVDTSGNSNKGLLIGDYKLKKNRKGQPMRRDSFIKVAKKKGNSKGAM
jgi:hypothetical protein